MLSVDWKMQREGERLYGKTYPWKDPETMPPLPPTPPLSPALQPVKESFMPEEFDLVTPEVAADSTPELPAIRLPSNKVLREVQCPNCQMVFEP
jgi:hypothetical protein